MPKLFLILATLSLTACGSVNPPKAPAPNENRRVPVNAYQPYEIQKVQQ